jgi:hypothetical protein
VFASLVVRKIMVKLGGYLAKEAYWEKFDGLLTTTDHIFHTGGKS